MSKSFHLNNLPRVIGANLMKEIFIFMNIIDDILGVAIQSFGD
jgi:hypothetical protein